MTMLVISSPTPLVEALWTGLALPPWTVSQPTFSVTSSPTSTAVRDSCGGVPITIKCVLRTLGLTSFLPSLVSAYSTPQTIIFHCVAGNIGRVKEDLCMH